MSFAFGKGPSIDVSHEPARVLRVPELRELSGEENADLKAMCWQLNTVAERNRERFVYYNAEQQFVNMNVAIPAEFEQYASVLGWNGTAVDTLARRIQLDGFVAPGSADRYTGMDAALRRTRFFAQAKMAVQSMLIYGVSFLAATRGPGGAQVQAFSARDATGLWDDTNPGRLRVGVAVLEWGLFGATRVLVFYPDRVIELSRGAAYADWDVKRYRSAVPGRVTLHPLLFLPQLDKPWGQSRITRPMLSLTRSAARAFMRAEMNGEIYGYPQLYGKNMRPEDAEQFRSGFAKFFAIDYERDEEGAPVKDAPEVQIGQVQVGSQQPHLEHLRSTAMLYAAESQLSPDKLGVIHDNPSSADAIDRADGELNDLAEEVDRDIDPVVLDAFHTLHMIESGTAALPPEVESLAGDWHDPGMTTRYSQRMAMASLVTAGAVVPGESVTYEAAGFSKTTAVRLAEAWQAAERRKNQQAIAEQALAARTSPLSQSLVASREAGVEL